MSLNPKPTYAAWYVGPKHQEIEIRLRFVNESYGINLGFTSRNALTGFKLLIDDALKVLPKNLDELPPDSEWGNAVKLTPLRHEPDPLPLQVEIEKAARQLDKAAQKLVTIARLLAEQKEESK